MFFTFSSYEKHDNFRNNYPIGLAISIPLKGQKIKGEFIN